MKRSVLWIFREDRIVLFSEVLTCLCFLPAWKEFPDVSWKQWLLVIAGCRLGYPRLPDMITHGQTGLLFPVDAEEILADRIETIASDEMIRNSLERRGRELIESRFSAANGKRVHAIILKNRRSGPGK